MVEHIPPSQRRIRLVAYGARLESVLGESPRGFESPILRESEMTHSHMGDLSRFFLENEKQGELLTASPRYQFL
jgi:hypothetical protein